MDRLLQRLDAFEARAPAAPGRLTMAWPPRRTKAVGPSSRATWSAYWVSHSPPITGKWPTIAISSGPRSVVGIDSAAASDGERPSLAIGASPSPSDSAGAPSSASVRKSDANSS